MQAAGAAAAAGSERHSCVPSSWAQFPSPDHKFVFVSCFARETETTFLQDAVGTICFRQCKRIYRSLGLGLLYNFNQMTRHFSAKTVSLEFGKSKIRYLDLPVAWRRTERARADTHIVFEGEVTCPGPI